MAIRGHLGSFWGHFGIVLGHFASFWVNGPFGDKQWEYYGIDVTFWRIYGNLKPFWGQLWPFWGTFVTFPSFLRSLLGHFESFSGRIMGDIMG